MARWFRSYRHGHLQRRSLRRRSSSARGRFSDCCFRTGLPWIFLFDGLAAEGTEKLNAEDGTIVVLGDIKQLYDPNRTVFRHIQVDADAQLTIDNHEHHFHAYHSKGNDMSGTGKTLTVPLNGSG
jgi:hypothetical protein